MQPFSFCFLLFVVGRGGGIGSSGRVRALNLTVPLGSGRVGSGRVGSGQTILGTRRVRASVLKFLQKRTGETGMHASYKDPFLF